MEIIKVDGMSCEHCEKAVAQAVGDLPGTKNVKVDLKAGTVSLDLGSETSLSQVKVAIEEAGYTCA